MPDPSALIAIRSKDLSAQIDPLGAQLFTLKDGEGRDLLWDGDPAVWSGRAPILFPIVGTLVDGRYRLGEAVYTLSRHGFARRKAFEVVETTPSAATLRLRADAESLESYPFQFELDLGFALLGPTLTLTATVKNLDDKALPASFGFHPALRWPLPYGQPRSAHTLRFDKDEPAPIQRINGDGVVKPDRFKTPVSGRTLALRDALFLDDALIFTPLNSQRLRYGAEAGPSLEIEFPETPYLGVWTKPHADFICVEPWHGLSDPLGFKGDFRDKPGVFEVAPGEMRKLVMAIRLHA
jgi:galactose mutarotase-like enzyme